MPGKSSKPEASEYETLVALVSANPRAWLGVGELATYFRLPETIVTAACNGNDSPFIGKNCHPDLFDQWLRDHAGLPSADGVDRNKAKKGAK